MTLGSAELLGVADRLGSIDAGKIANVVVVKGDLFGKDKYVTHVFVDGKYFEQKEPPKKEASTGKGGGGPAGNVASVGGTYSITIDIPGQPMAATLTFNQQGSTFSGTMVSQLGTTEIANGKVTAEGFSFGGTVPFGGSMIDIAVSGSVKGNNISGTIDSPQGAVPFYGTKNP